MHSTHLRDEADELNSAITEAAEVSKSSGAPLQISHLKVIGEHNWGSIHTALSLIDEIHSDGVDVGFDVYPYSAGSGPITTYFKPDNIDQTRAKLVKIIRCADFPNYEGQKIIDIANSEGATVADITHRIITAPNADQTLCIIFEINENDMIEVLTHPLCVIGSDGIPQPNGVPHPRLHGTFPRVLGHYSAKRKLLARSEAIKKMASQTAQRFGLPKRGLLKVGYFADVTVFCPATIADRGSFTRRANPIGIHHVLVNGKLALTNSKPTGMRAGRVLSRKETS